ncbi:MAG: tail fiber protein [Acidobacteriota bacterium]
MAEPFLAEIRIMSFNFAPRGWAMCNGQFLPINQNQALFSLLGTIYGGNGQTTFALPDLRAKTPIHFGSHTQGETAGEQAHTLNISELPQHVHLLQATNTDIPANRVAIPTNNFLGPVNNLYANPSGVGVQLTTMDPSSVTNVGGSQPHNNMMPSLALTFCIALQGIFPSRN